MAFIIKHRILGLLAASVATLVVTNRSAHAGAITGCGQVVDTSTNNGWLTQDIPVTGGSTCVEVRNGKNLNLNGYQFYCQGNSDCSSTVAVGCGTSDGLHTSSLIYSDTHGDDGHVDILGNFAAGVKNCGTVKNLKISGAQTGILFDHSSTNGEDYFGNVIIPSSNGRGIDVKVMDSGDSVYENQVTGGDVGIYLRQGRSVSTGALVRRNILRSYTSTGIESGTSDYFRIEENSVIEGDAGSVPFDAPSSNSTYTNNICENEGDVDLDRCACEMDRMSIASVANCPLL